MRLIACDTCHTQFDVTEVRAERIPCRCGATLRNELPEAVDAKVERCPSCGASTSDDEASCAYCGCEIVREPGKLSLICPECYGRCAEDARFCTACGLEFRPEEVRLGGYALPCPACDDSMPPQQVAGLGLNECTRCRGLWVPGEAFDALVARTCENRDAARVAGQPGTGPRVSGGNPAHQSVAYRKCPECQDFMHRVNYRKSSGVIVDVCHTHGTWLDADELERIAGFLAEGGETSKTIVQEDAAAERAYRRLRMEGRRAEARHDQRIIVEDTTDTLGTLLDVVGTLLKRI